MTQHFHSDHAKLARLAQSYAPQWQFSLTQPDAGSAAAILIDNMLSQSEDRLGNAVHMHKIQYLNLFDRLKEEPIESAKSYARFTQATGMDAPVRVPRGTQLIAENSGSGERLYFETAYGITTSAADLDCVYATDRSTDRIVCLKESGGSEKSFRAFDLNTQNQARHRLMLGYDGVLEALSHLSIGLRVTGADAEPETLEETLSALLSPDVTYSMLENQGEHPFDTVVREGNLIRLTAENYLPQTVEFEGSPRYVLCIDSKRPMDAQLASVELVFSEKNLPADEILCAGVSQSIGRFAPFGSPMEIFSECGIESRAIFARRGAAVDLHFDLDFVTIEQKLPEIENTLDLKIIMKKPVEAPKTEMVEIRADSVLVEYRCANGWKRLLPDEHAALLFNGSATGAITLSFICPMDIAAEDGEPRMRLRLMRADNLYRIPSIQYCPILCNLRFSYSYEERCLLPNVAVTQNNFDEQNVTALLEKKKPFTVFYNRESEWVSMYLGFNHSMEGQPFSLYFEVENDEDAPLDFSVEYLSDRGFEPVTAIDNTGGLLCAGTLLVPVPADVVQKTLFGQSCWWLRMSMRTALPESLPTLRAITTNMARIENLRTRTEFFYLTDPDAPLHIALDSNNLISAKVFVNEEDGDDTREENWVLWRKRVSIDEQGRYYSLDLAAGVVDFERHAFAPHPVKSTAAAIRVEYQSYQGAAANVGPNCITSLAESLRFISGVTNPMAAYGGYDGYNEQTSSAIISNMLRTRGRAVTGQDYFDIISQVSYGVRRIKCVSGVNRQGEPEDDVITVALLIDEFDKGSHIFSSVKDTIRKKLLETSSMIPLGKTLILSQPHFVRFSARLWIDCPQTDSAYDLQQRALADISRFLDPLQGGFEGNGWEIGELPTVRQLLAYLKMKHPGIVISRIVMSAQSGGHEFAVDDDIVSYINNPFAMAVSGTHLIYVSLTAK